MHLEKDILKGKRFTPKQLKREAKEEFREGNQAKARMKALEKKCK